MLEVGVEALPALFDVRARPGAELSARSRAAAQRAGHLLERVAEDVM